MELVLEAIDRGALGGWVDVGSQDAWAGSDALARSCVKPVCLHGDQVAPSEEGGDPRGLLLWGSWSLQHAGRIMHYRYARYA